jgi:H+-translocating NAD(P) transhydrogenase subunit alpha
VPDPAPAASASAGLQTGPRTIGVPKELFPGERRVALVPAAVQKLVKRGFKVVVEHGAGAGASFLDQDYQQAGATLADAAGVWSQGELILKVRGPMQTPTGRHEAEQLREGAWLVSFIWPAQNRALLDQLAARKAVVLAMDMVPRITRAQKLDALSVMGNIAGYRAVLEGAHHYGRTLGGSMTAAGKVKPATVFVLGAGVAGLAAIGAARNLGAQVKAFDTRAAVREQVESMGGQFVELKFEESGEGEGGYAKEMSDAFVAAEQALIAQHAKDSDIIITTALIPGKKAPVLVNSGAVVGMPRGSVIVDLAAEQGGNCALTERDKVIEKFGVTIVGSTDLTSRMSLQASELYSGALVNLLDEILGKADGLKLNFADEVQRSMTVTKEGEITWPPPKMEMRAGAPRAFSRDIKAVVPPPKPPSPLPRVIGSALLTAALVGLGIWAPPGLLSHVTIFLLACVVGWQVVWNVTPALHTPLMSVTNAISGIILIGGMLLSLSGGLTVANWLAAVAVLVAAINVAGGFLVTQRMLKMFRR